MMCLTPTIASAQLLPPELEQNDAPIYIQIETFCQEVADSGRVVEDKKFLACIRGALKALALKEEEVKNGT